MFVPKEYPKMITYVDTVTHVEREIKKDFTTLPTVLAHKVFSFLNPGELAKSTQLNKRSKVLASHKPLWQALILPPNPKLNLYRKILLEIVEEINKLNRPHSNPIYENLRQHCLNKNKILIHNPGLIFADHNQLDANTLNKKYKKLALVFHPDKNGGREGEATVIFKLVKEAYEYLKNG